MSHQSVSVDAKNPLVDITSKATSGELQPNSLIVASELYRLRRVRARKFGAEAYIFGDPAWDILLNLFIAYRSGNKVSKSNAALAGETPESTGYRILKELDKIGLVQNEKDSSDRRRIFVSLTKRACAMMEACLQTSNVYNTATPSETG
jgi:hypothetical protein